MLGTFLTLPSDWFATTTAYMGYLFTDISPFIFLVIGVLLATFIVEWLIGILQ